MNFRRMGLGLRVLLVVSACACKKNEDKKPRTREEFCSDWAAAACSAETVSACQATDADSCRATQASACRKLVPDDFSDAMGQDCIAAVKAAYADADLKGDELKTVISLGDPCDKLIRGNKDEGEDCDTDTDCDGPAGYACVRHADSNNGTCQEPQLTGAGKDCSAEQKVCGPGFYCNGDNCIEAKDAGDECTIQEECGDAAFCSAVGKCETKHKVNTACTSDIECAAGVCYVYDGKPTCTDRIRLGRSEPLCEDLK